MQLIPERELRNQVAEGDDQAEHGDGKACHGRKAEGHLRVIRDAQHRDVVETEKIVARVALGASWLVVSDFGTGVSEVADEAAEVRVLLVGSPELLDDFAIVQAEPGEIVDELHVR